LGALLVVGLVFGWWLSRLTQRNERELHKSLAERDREVNERTKALILEIERGKLTEAALVKSERRYRAIFEQSFQLSGVTDPQGILIDINRSALALVNAEMREVIGRHISEIAWWNHVPEEVDRLRTALVAAAQGVFVRYETTINAADGSTHALDFSLKPINDDEGAVVLVILEGRDITELKNSERERLSLAAQLHQSQRLEALGQLAGGVAHDFNNLLTVITGNLSLLQEGQVSDSQPSFDIQETLDATHRAGELTRQLLAFSRRQIVEPRVFYPAESLTGLRKLLPHVVGEDISLKISVMGDPGSVFLDPSQFDQVVMNLIVNARDAMPSGGQLDITLSRIELEDPAAVPRGPSQAGTYVLLTVSDTGTGIPESIIAQLFEPFFTTKAPGTGTGLGLTTVHGIVTQASGAIAVDSRLGWGTTFRVYLPSCDCPPPSSKRAAALEVEPRMTATVLVVEDQGSVRDLVVRVLNRFGLEVSGFACATSALEYARTTEHVFDLVLTDVVMPEMGGPSLANALRELRPSVPIIFMSGHIDDTLLRNEIAGSHEFFLAKPFTPKALLEKVRAVLELSQPRIPDADP
jgi:PAS domain S-box-containing protein